MQVFQNTEGFDYCGLAVLMDSQNDILNCPIGATSTADLGIGLFAMLWGIRASSGHGIGEFSCASLSDPANIVHLGNQVNVPQGCGGVTAGWIVGNGCQALWPFCSAPSCPDLSSIYPGQNVGSYQTTQPGDMGQQAGYSDRCCVYHPPPAPPPTSTPTPIPSCTDAGGICTNAYSQVGSVVHCAAPESELSNPPDKYDCKGYSVCCKASDVNTHPLCAAQGGMCVFYSQPGGNCLLGSIQGKSIYDSSPKGFYSGSHTDLALRDCGENGGGSNLCCSFSCSNPTTKQSGICQIADSSGMCPGGTKPLGITANNQCPVNVPQPDGTIVNTVCCDPCSAAKGECADSKSAAYKAASNTIPDSNFCESQGKYCVPLLSSKSGNGGGSNGGNGGGNGGQSSGGAGNGNNNQPPPATPTPTPMPPTGSIALDFEGVDANNNTHPKGAQREITLYFFSKYQTPNFFSNINKADFKIDTAVNFDSNPNDTNTYGDFVNRNIPFPDIPTGDYFVMVKSPEGSLMQAVAISSPLHIQRGINNILADPTQFGNNSSSTNANDQTSTLPVIQLIMGDIANENTVGVDDYNIIVDCYEGKATSATCLSHTTADGRPIGSDKYVGLLADLNNDGKVDGIDYNIVLRHYQQNGY